MMNSKLVTYEQLELLPTGNLSTQSPSKFAQGRKAVVGQLLRFFAPTNEPKVRSHSDKNGEAWFDAYDPVTQQRLPYSSEEAMRLWLEQRYYTKSWRELY